MIFNRLSTLSTFQQVCCSNANLISNNIRRISSEANQVETSVPRRALMYCPGDDLKKVTKGLTSKADCIALDCEDGVAVNRKKAARDTIRSVLCQGGLPTRPEVGVRLNSVDSGMCEDDMAAILSADHLPPTLLLPKVDSKQHLQWFGEKVDRYLPPASRMNLILYAESARAIMDLPEICRVAVDLSKTHRFDPVALVLGSDDLCANIGTARSVDGAEILYARQRLVLVAKAFGFQAIDMVHIQFKDLESLRAQCEAGARLGYTGKQVIHPGQIDTVQTAFMPSQQQIERARAIVVGFQHSQKLGKGAFVFEGSMVDMPLLKQAENIIRLAELEAKS